MFSITLSILEAAVGFGFLIFVHELGHFLACKWTGVRVEIFSLGFGPALKRKWGDTEYRLSIVPLGGYIKMAGEEPKGDKPPEPYEFYSKTVGQRTIILAAGVVMNLVCGFVAFMLAYQVGKPVVPAVIGDVEPGSPAWKAGLRRGDRIEAIHGVSAPIDFEDLRTTVTLAGRGEGIRLTVNRDGQIFHEIIYPEYRKEIGLPTAGIYQPTTMVVAKVQDVRRAMDDGDVDVQKVFAAGLRPGDVITAVQTSNRSEPVATATPQEFLNAIDDCEGKPIRIFYVRAGKGPPRSVTVSPDLVGAPRWLGIRFGSNRVNAVRSGSWAEKAGIEVGDAIVSVDEKQVRARSAVLKVLDAQGAARVAIVVRRQSADLRLTADVSPPADAAIAFEPDLAVDSTWPGFAAARAGLQPGDEILSASGIPVEDAAALGKVLVASKGQPIRLAWCREGVETAADVRPQKQWTIGLPLELAQTVLRAGLVDSCFLGARKATQWAVWVYGTLRSLVSGQVSARHLSGPISIGYIAYAAAREGAGTLLYILGVLSVNLGVVNLLPIPVLDGGHIAFAALEKLRGRPISENVRSAATYVGLSVIIALLFLAFWNDIYGFLLHGVLG